MFFSCVFEGYKCGDDLGLKSGGKIPAAQIFLSSNGETLEEIRLGSDSKWTPSSSDKSPFIKVLFEGMSYTTLS